VDTPVEFVFGDDGRIETGCESLLQFNCLQGCCDDDAERGLDGGAVVVGEYVLAAPVVDRYRNYGDSFLNLRTP
jgi:hypothetical protein